MTQRARDADAIQVQFAVSPLADLPLHADNGIQTQQRKRRLRIIERNGAVYDACDDRRRQRGGVDFQADRCSGERIHRRLDHRVHLQHVGPERLVAKRVEAKGLLTRGHQLRIERQLRHLAGSGQRRRRNHRNWQGSRRARRTPPPATMSCV